MNPKVDIYINNDSKWQTELEQLRMIILDCGLNEDFKWGVPCYTLKNSNVILLGSFKEYCVISFVKGALLADTNKVLIQQTENSQSVRIIRFTNVAEIKEMKATLKAYIFEAIEVENAGLKVEYKKNTELEFPEELQKVLSENQDFKNAFEALTPGRQRAYNMFFSEPKQAATRATRIEKYFQRILDGKGINDCTCGLTKKKPNCDGSHKQLKQIND